MSDAEGDYGWMDWEDFKEELRKRDPKLILRKKTRNVRTGTARSGTGKEES